MPPTAGLILMMTTWRKGKEPNAITIKDPEKFKIKE
jgi:hypothetical protein